MSYETIYRSLFVQAKGTLSHELTGHLRSRRAVRQPWSHNRTPGSGRGQRVDMVHISERPAEAADRPIPGQAGGMCGIATVVERPSRPSLLMEFEEIRAVTVAGALGRHIQTLPAQLRQSLPWDQTKKKALYTRVTVCEPPLVIDTVDTGVQVYFCEPKGPLHPGTDENSTAR